MTDDPATAIATLAGLTLVVLGLLYATPWVVGLGLATYAVIALLLYPDTGP